MLILTRNVFDFPGFEEGIQGPDLMMKMRQQAARFAARFVEEDVVSVDFSKTPFTINTESQTLQSESVIVATGASAMWLGIPSEAALIGKGISACAVCDGLFFKDKDVYVVGGGDTAMREAQHLSKVCRTVTIIHRRGEFRAQAALQNLLKQKTNVKFMMESVIDEYLGSTHLTGVKIKNTRTGEIVEHTIDGVFVAIGHSPNTTFLKDQLDLDEKGYIQVFEQTKTSVTGVFVAGDVADHRYRQAVTAAGAGCMAALDVESFLEEAQNTV